MRILINNYDGSTEMKVDLTSNLINLFICKESNSADGVVNYFKNYSIIQKKKISVADVKNVKTTIKDRDYPLSLFRLKDKRIAA